MFTRTDQHIAVSYTKGVLMISLMVAAVGTAYAQTYGSYLKDSLFGSLTQQEQASYSNASAKVLNDPRSGVVTLWQSPAGRKSSVSAELRADSLSKQGDMDCRMLHSNFRQGSAQEGWHFSMCKDSTGKWKAVSQNRAPS